MLTLLLFLFPTPACVQGPLPVDRGGQELVPDRYAELEAEYDQAALDWRAARRAAKKEQTSFDDPNPIHDYFPRFQAFAQGGEGRAVLWVGLHAPETDRTPGEVRALERSSFDRVVRDFVREDWVLGLVKSLSKQEDWLEDEEICGYLDAVYRGQPRSGIAALAGYTLAQRYSVRGTEADTDRAVSIWKRIVRRYAKTKTAEKAQARLDARRYLVGKVPPDFTAEDVDGNAFALSDYRGKVVVLDFWGFWCSDCVQEIHDLQALVERHRDDPFALIGVDTDDERESYRQQAAEHDIAWRDAWTGGTGSELPRTWGVRSYPTSFVLDPEGRIRAIGLHGERLEELVAELLAETGR